MDKEFGILQLSNIVFYMTSLLLGLHISYLTSFIFTSNLAIHKESLLFMYVSIPYSFEVAQDELYHMIKAGELFLLSHALLVLFLLLTIFLLWYFKKSSMQPGTSFFVWPIVSFITMLIVLPFFMFFFEIFHKILFTDDTWKFELTSPIIQAYPLSFFIIQFIVIIVSSIIIHTGIYRFLKSPNT